MQKVEAAHGIIDVNIEQGEIVLTPNQQLTTNVFLYFRTLDLIDTAARNYSLWKTSKKEQGVLDPDELHAQASTALYDLSLINGDKDKLNAFQKDWGEETEVFQNIFTRLKEKVKNERPQFEEKVRHLGKIGKSKTSIQTIRRLLKLPDDQKQGLIEITGYSKEEAINICKKMATSGVLTGVEYSAFFFGGSFAAGIGAVYPFLNEMDETTKTIIIASYVAKYLPAILNTFESIRLLDEKSINNSPNAFTTGAYYLLDKLSLRRKKERDLILLGATLIEPFLVDVGFGGLLAAPDIGPSAITARNLYSSALNLLESGAKEAYLRYKRKNSEDYIILATFSAKAK